MAHAAPVVVVTGATGFVASELVKQLLAKGYTVRGTVRSLQNKDKVQHLEKLGQAMPGHLTLHEADLLKVHNVPTSDHFSCKRLGFGWRCIGLNTSHSLLNMQEGSFDSVMRGASYIFHTA